MHSKPQKRTAERLTCRESWKSCLPAKTEARTRMPPPFLQPSCALRSRFEAGLKGPEQVKLDAGNQRQGRRHHWGFGKALGHGFRVAPVLGGDINSDRLRKITNHYLATK